MAIATSVVLLHFLLVLLPVVVVHGGHDYATALSKSILFYEAQRSGHLPANQRVTWRANSGLNDGKANGIDLVGGYYDAGDNVKFGLPMAFTITMLSWSIVEYGKQMSESGELGHALDAVKWGTDYFIKAHPEPDVLYGEVGDGNTDHRCWQRPEDMTTSRLAYRIDPSNPGSDLAGETAAAMAAASVAFRGSSPSYSNELLNHAKQLFDFADKHRGKYDSSISVARSFYESFSGYDDELLWAAAWLYEATNDQYYLNYLTNNAAALGGTGWGAAEFGWDVKYAGVQVLATKFLLQGKGGAHSGVLENYQQKAEEFMCSCIGRGTNNVQRTPGGLMFRQRWNNLQFVTGASFLLTVFSDYFASAGENVQCASGSVTPNQLFTFAKSQVDYILGDNPRATSYMVGYGSLYPQQVHHRGASIVSIKVNPTFVSCSGGYSVWYGRRGSDPNILHGAIVGGPDAYDNFADERNNYEQTEAATYNNAPLVGLLARINSANGDRNQLYPVAPHNTPTRKVKPSPRTPARSSRTQARHSSSPFTVEQRATSSWSINGRSYGRYSVIITNKSSKTAREVNIHITKLYGQVWGLNKLRYGYQFPKWLNSLPAGKSMEFGYINSGSPAWVSITGYKLV